MEAFNNESEVMMVDYPVVFFCDSKIWKNVCTSSFSRIEYKFLYKNKKKIVSQYQLCFLLQIHNTSKLSICIDFLHVNRQCQ